MSLKYFVLGILYCTKNIILNKANYTTTTTNNNNNNNNTDNNNNNLQHQNC